MSVNLEGLTLEEQAELYQKLSQAPAQFAELQRQQADEVQRIQDRNQAKRLADDLEQAITAFQAKRNQVAVKLQAWLDQAAQVATEIERLNREANTVFRLAQAQAQAAVTASLTAPPILPGDYSGIAQDEIRKRTGSPHLMNLLPKPDHPAAQHVAQALAGYCSDRRFGFGYTPTNRPTWGLPPGAIE